MAAAVAAVLLCTAAPASAAVAQQAAGRPAAAVPAAVPAAVKQDLTQVFPIVDCVVTSSDGTFRAVFGYVNTGGARTIPHGGQNQVWPGSIDGGQPTSFSHGTVHGAYSTPPMSILRWATWRLGDGIVTAVGGVNTCGPDVTLPTEGNGIGPMIVILASVGLSLAIGAVRGWQLRRRQRKAA